MSVDQSSRGRLPKAKARFGFRSRIVVDRCPYCGCTHYHSAGGDEDTYVRESDCLPGGSYELTFGTVEDGE